MNEYASAIRLLADPWRVVAAPERVALEKELARELAPSHPLHGMHCVAIARCAGCDDVVFSVEGGTARFVLVHLVWGRSGPETPPWPSTTFLDLPLVDTLREFMC